MIDKNLTRAGDLNKGDRFILPTELSKRRVCEVFSMDFKKRSVTYRKQDCTYGKCTTDKLVYKVIKDNETDHKEQVQPKGYHNR